MLHFKIFPLKISVYIGFVLFCLLQGTLVAQQQPVVNDNQVALEYYRNGEYDKAAEVYKKLFYTQQSSVFFSYYLNCLIALEDYDEAEKVAKLQIKNFKSDLNYLVDLGHIYELQEKSSKAASTYQEAIKRSGTSQHQTTMLANAFLSKRLYTYAEETYLKARKEQQNGYGFQMELARIYYYQRKYEPMIGQYLDLLALNEQYVQAVQNQLQNAVYNDIDGSLKQLLKDALLQRIQSDPDMTIYNELLLWLYVQDKDFPAALLQAKALDMRLDESGQRLVSLARIAGDNNDFSTAIEAYEYVVSKGRNQEFFYAARNEMLELMFQRIDKGLDARKEDFERLEQSYISAIEDLGTGVESADMIRNLAHLQAFYLGKTTEAIFLLEDVITLPHLRSSDKAAYEIELADIYLAAGKVWEATFAYARVEEAQKNNPIGSEAKFRKARLAYYIGNYGWAMAQLDVLKGSTSKLMANDAAWLSLFIYDNTGWGDSTETAMGMYSRADFLHYQSKDSLALLALDSLIQNYSSHMLADDAWFLKAQIYQENQRWAQAEQALLTVMDTYGYDILGDRATYMLAYQYETVTNEQEKAMEMYRKLLLQYTGSVYTVEARKRYRALRGDS